VKTSVRWRHNGLELRLPGALPGSQIPRSSRDEVLALSPQPVRAAPGRAPARTGGETASRKSTGTVCGLPALCRTPSRPSTHLHRTCGAPQVQVCGLGRCILSGGTRGQVCGAGVQGPSEVLASAGGYSSARNSSSILSATYIFSRDW